MADTNGNPTDSLIERLVQRPYAFDFFLAVRLLESRRPDLPRVGFSHSPAEEAIRFWQKPSPALRPLRH
jgi:type VI secretion system protein ImpH